MSQDIKASIVIERSYAAPVEELWALWTTKDGFESWWGPQGFRADVSLIESRQGGALHYEMIADSAEMIEGMKQMGQPVSHAVRGNFTDYRPNERLVLSQIIDFLPGVTPYDSIMQVDFVPAADDRVRMIVTLSPMHNPEFSAMQGAGFTSQLSKLDARYGWQEA